MWDSLSIWACFSIIAGCMLSKLQSLLGTLEGKQHHSAICEGGHGLLAFRDSWLCDSLQTLQCMDKILH